jgi:hypothetical protein
VFVEIPDEDGIVVIIKKEKEEKKTPTNSVIT